MIRGDRLISRREALVAGGAAALAANGLPAWARTFASAATSVRKPDSLPFPHLPAGTPSMPKIDHIVVLMMENHSFDNLLGAVPWRVKGRELIDGFTRKHGQIVNFNRDASGRKIHAQSAVSPCQLDGVPSQAWNASHESYDHGRNEGFVRASGPIAMRYWDDADLPFTYSLAKHFPLGQRYFCSVLAQTYPNRRFLFTGTASGTIATDKTTFHIRAANGSIFDRLEAQGISYGVYSETSAASWLILPNVLSNPTLLHHQHTIAQFYADTAAGRLPKFTFLDPNYTTTSEENPQDIQVGEEFIGEVVHALMTSPQWKNTALFITYDEHGGYYDHVPPPRAIKPDNIAPVLAPGDVPGAYDRYGFRVPMIVVSPWARAGYVSNVVQDHTSMLAFIERKWNLPAMTFRDANAAPMTDYFDFKHAAFMKPPALKRAPGLAAGLRQCHAAGLNPPLPTAPNTASDISRSLAGAVRR
ncbi:MAG TPA: alkaline phosphatase family protein [Solirubrobacteraceae bacterium]|nr:alkaline phosphatase family protein [Solirubrobacteraceae bacterium]